MNTFLKKLTKQSHTATWIGGIKEVLAHTLFWISMINFVLISVTAYNTTLKPYIMDYAPWMTYPVFFLALTILVGIAMIVEYKIIIPGVISFRNNQEYAHQSPIKKDLEKIKKALNIKDD